MTKRLSAVLLLILASAFGQVKDSLITVLPKQDHSATGRLVLMTKDGAHSLTLRASDSMAADKDCTLPNADGANGDVLTTDGNCHWSFAAPGTGGSLTFPFADSTAMAKNNTDNTKLAKLDLSGLTTGTTRTMHWPDSDFTPAGLGLANVFTANQQISKADALMIVGGTGEDGLLFYKSDNTSEQQLTEWYQQSLIFAGRFLKDTGFSAGDNFFEAYRNTGTYTVNKVRFPAGYVEVGTASNATKITSTEAYAVYHKFYDTLGSTASWTADARANAFNSKFDVIDNSGYEAMRLERLISGGHVSRAVFSMDLIASPMDLPTSDPAYRTTYDIGTLAAPWGTLYVGDIYMTGSFTGPSGVAMLGVGNIFTQSNAFNNAVLFHPNTDGGQLLIQNPSTYDDGLYLQFLSNDATASAAGVIISGLSGTALPSVTINANTTFIDGILSASGYVGAHDITLYQELPHQEGGQIVWKGADESCDTGCTGTAWPDWYQDIFEDQMRLFNAATADTTVSLFNTNPHSVNLIIGGKTVGTNQYGSTSFANGDARSVGYYGAMFTAIPPDWTHLQYAVTGVRGTIGPYDTADSWGGQSRVTMDAVQGMVNVPADADVYWFTGGHYDGDVVHASGLSGQSQTFSDQAKAIGIFTNARGFSTNASAFGGNFECELGSTATGYAQCIGLEIDLNMPLNSHRRYGLAITGNWSEQASSGTPNIAMWIRPSQDYGIPFKQGLVFTSDATRWYSGVDSDFGGAINIGAEGPDTSPPEGRISQSIHWNSQDPNGTGYWYGRTYQDNAGEIRFTPGRANGGNTAGIVVDNRGSGSATAAYSFGVDYAGEGSCSTATNKGAYTFTRGGANGTGYASLYVNRVTDCSRWDSSPYNRVFTADGSTFTLLHHTSVANLLTVDAWLNSSLVLQRPEMQIYNQGGVAQWAVYQPLHATDDKLHFAKLVAGSYTDFLTFDPAGTITVNEQIIAASGVDIGSTANPFRYGYFDTGVITQKVRMEYYAGASFGSPVDYYDWQTVGSHVFRLTGSSGQIPLQYSETIRANWVLNGDLIPSGSSSWDIGNSSYKWRNLAISGNAVIDGTITVASCTGCGTGAPSNMMTTDTSQTVTGQKSFYASPIAASGVDIGSAANPFTNGYYSGTVEGTQFRMVYGSLASPTDYYYLTTSSSHLFRLVDSSGGIPLQLNDNIRSQWFLRGDVLPNTSATWDLGNASLKWRSITVGANTVYRCTGSTNTGTLTSDYAACGGVYVDSGLRVN